ncbi:hypothetical protein HYDPIDRAFT_129705 [Hydnomerulius pinastri MD-312]|nr:hypothetical protein HYDPIDRAFT_129705 [Hydnomerulius pinastri MD-312]
MNFLDRYNAAAARLRGLEEDLHMSGRQFNTLISVLYIGYVLMQTPSNIFIDRLQKPSFYISCCVLLWGLCSLGTGLSQSYHGALACRFFLGFCEAAFGPGSIFLLSRWYKRDELALRLAILTSGSSVSYAFGAIIAGGVMEFMDGQLGLAGWRWLFVLEGSATILVAFLGFFIIPDYPTTPASWLTPEERAIACTRMEEDVLTYDQEFVTTDKSKSGSIIIETLTDWKVWWLGIALACIYASGSFSNYFPTLSETMGYGPTVSLLLCAPPWLLATVSSLHLSRHSDSLRERFWHIVAPLLVGIAGFILAISTMSISIRYLSLFIMAQSPLSVLLFTVWVSNSFPHSSAKRAIALAFINSLGTCGNIGASYFWPSAWGPSYTKSYLLCILMTLIAIPMLWVHRTHLESLNKAAEEKERALGEERGFRYLL